MKKRYKDLKGKNLKVRLASGSLHKAHIHDIDPIKGFIHIVYHTKHGKRNYKFQESRLTNDPLVHMIKFEKFVDVLHASDVLNMSMKHDPNWLFIYDDVWPGFYL